MNNPEWILAQLAPVVVAYAETLPDGRPYGDWYGVHYWLENVSARLGSADYSLKWLGRELTTCSHFRLWCVDTIPRNTPTWHAYLMFLRYYHG